MSRLFSAGVIVAALFVVVRALPAIAEKQDVPLRQLSQTIAAEEGRDDAVLLDLMPWIEYYDFVNRWMNDYKAAPPYVALVRGEADERFLRQLAQHPRVWLVLPQTPPAPSEAASSTEQWWATRAAFLDERWFGGVRVARFIPVPAGSYAATGPAITLGKSVQLIAPEVTQSEGLIIVTLHWRARQALHQDLHVFVQLLNSEGRAVAAQDRVPCSGFAPTTSWQAGQVVTDRHALPLPAESGPFRVIAGLYDPETGTRLKQPDGTDWVELGQIEE